MAARFDHVSSATGDPHLHTHLLLVNALHADDGRWSAVASSPLWRTERELETIYHLALRHHVDQAGYHPRWDLGPDGRADLADVPRSAIVAASRRQAQMAAHRQGGREATGSAAARAVTRSRIPASAPESGLRLGEDGGRGERRDRAPASASEPDSDQSRDGGRGERRDRAPASASEPDSDQSRGGANDAEGWRRAVAAAGLDAAEAGAVLTAGDRDQASHHGAGAVLTAGDRGRVGYDGDGAVLTAGDRGRVGYDGDAVGAALAAKASSFTIRDVIRAIGATSVPGMTAAAAEDHAARFCGQAVALGSGRWTTARALAADQAVVHGIAERIDAGVGTVDRRRLEAAEADRALDDAGRASVRQLLGGGRGVDVVSGAAGQDRLAAQAAVIDVARRAWQASGYQVAVIGGGRRWEALTALPDQRTMTGPAQVLIVDGADRLSPPELGHILDEARATNAKAVLVEGGTLPGRARPWCTGLVSAGNRFGRLDPGTVSALPDGPRRGVDAGNGITVVATGRDALAHLLDHWEHAAAARRPLLVGAGPAEVAILNDAASARLVEAGAIGPEMMAAGGRTFLTGQRVLALRANRALDVAGAALGTVTAIEAGGRAMTVSWDGGAEGCRIERGRAGFVGHGWATTPALAATTGVDVAVLGPPGRNGPDRARVRAATVVAPVLPRSPQRHPTLDAAVLDAGVAGTTVAPEDRSVDALAAERRRLGRMLSAGLPAATVGERADVDAERRWRAETGRAPDPTLEERRAGLDRGDADRSRWLTDHAGALGRWDALGQALEDRADLAARAQPVGRAMARGPDVGHGADRPVGRAAATTPAPKVVRAERAPESSLDLSIS